MALSPQGGHNGEHWQWPWLYTSVLLSSKLSDIYLFIVLKNWLQNASSAIGSCRWFHMQIVWERPWLSISILWWPHVYYALLPILSCLTVARSSFMLQGHWMFILKRFSSYSSLLLRLEFMLQGISEGKFKGILVSVPKYIKHTDSFFCTTHFEPATIRFSSGV